MSISINLKSYFPSWIKSGYHLAKNIPYLIAERNFVVLNSMAKSGTNYFRLFFTNYLKVYYDNAETPVSYRSMHHQMFPNIREYILFENAKYVYPDPIIQEAGYKDFVYGHSVRALKLCSAKIVNIHRNPLDNIVSRFYNKWKYRPERENLYQSPRDVFDIVLDRYIRDYVYVRNLAKVKRNILRISYESMILKPEATFQAVLDWLGIPFDQTACSRALEFSSIKRVRQEEALHGPIHSPEGFKGSFVRSGKVGQWQEYFDDNDIVKLKSTLGKHDINMDEFVFTAPALK